MRLKIKRIIITSFMIINIAGLCLAQEFAGGNGTEADPWQIETAEHLNNVRNYSGNDHSDKHFVQTANINLGVPPWNQGEGWVRIGPPGISFQGTYEGNNYLIYGITINRPESSSQGLFGWIENSEIKNLGLIKICIIGRSWVGGLTGYASDSIIKNCFTTGSVESQLDLANGIVRYY